MINLLRKFVVNREERKSVFLLCRATVKKDAVKRMTENGKEYIIVNSATLPDDVVMNGVLYPATEIENSYQTLQGTPAPVEHPNMDGEFIPATDPRAINEFYVGAWNERVWRENGRVYVDKKIDVAEAMKKQRGRDLLARIVDIENNENAQPIHTSVGVFIDMEELDEPVTNAAGEEYTAIARDMYFDHDAILLYSIGAATPEKGVGMAVNKKGKKLTVCKASLETNETSLSEVAQKIYEALERQGITTSYIEEVYTDSVVYQGSEGYFKVPYTMDEAGRATIVGLPMPVERVVSYKMRSNHREESTMRELILNALKGKGVEVDGLSDEQLLEKYQALAANQKEGQNEGDSNLGGTGFSADNIVKALQANLDKSFNSLQSEIKTLTEKVTANENAKRDELAELVVNSGKYPGMDLEAAKLLPQEKLEAMAAHCQPSYGLNPVLNNQSEGFKPFEMPN